MLDQGHVQSSEELKGMKVSRGIDPILNTVLTNRLLDSCADLFLQVHAVQLRNGTPTFQLKPDGSLVSDFEIEVERQICEMLAQETPECVIEGEEGFRYQPDHKTSYKWSVDPIDGSISFRNQLPYYTFVATLVKDESTPLAAVIVAPLLGKVVQASLGGGTWINGKRADLLANSPSESSVYAVSDDSTFGMVDRQEILAALRRLPNPIRTYTDAFGHSLVAEGLCALKFDAACAEWDRYPAELVVSEAGGETVFFPVASPNPDLCGSLLVGHPQAVARVRKELGV
jgi:fructose-1,6-bisphosphatase/inositol monophosphatase family enzyme